LVVRVHDKLLWRVSGTRLVEDPRVALTEQ
jgi:hypothetical protein